VSAVMAHLMGAAARMAVSTAKSALVLGDYAVTTPIISRPERSS
jgi:hypothetical protein